MMRETEAQMERPDDASPFQSGTHNGMMHVDPNFMEKLKKP